jgi:hypothetical protein
MDVLVANGGFKEGLCCTHWNTHIGGTGNCYEASKEQDDAKRCGDNRFYCNLKGDECF